MNIDDVRAALDAARAELCSHGVTPTHCREQHPTEEPSDA
jgi:hypothetical protein